MNDMTPPATIADHATRLRAEPDQAATIRAMGRAILDLMARVAALEAKRHRPKGEAINLRRIKAGEAVCVIAEMITKAAIESAITPATIIGSSRKRDVNEARQWVMLEAQEAGCQPSIIARELGRRDESTIRHGIARERQRRALNEGVVT